MKTAKIGALFLVALMALTGASAGYAMWTETITMSGTVNTGNIGIDWSVDHCYDSEAANKDVSYASAYVGTDGVLYVTVTNAYPGIAYSVVFDIHSVGTVPVHFFDFILNEGNCERSWITISPYAGYPAITSAQLHQGDSWWGILTINLNNDAVQNGVYTFSISITGHQYNEP